ncbi:MAG: FKBP-type peptidyl-prolyl cis-trans isomerase [Spirochaetaceae bacterium]|jgi:FKBP-type peptidyl-prolyl cis-trans isomerase FkpA|nr:FKBP-type peptidyl-prolyl cis-trans isomerase [Spirochaetaceae bacterium]
MLKKTVIAITMATVVLFACVAGGKSDKNAETSKAGETPAVSAQAAEVEGSDPDTSYAFGLVLGTDLKQTGLQFNYDEFIKGFSDSLEGKTTRISNDEAIQIIQSAFTAAMAARAEENRQRETVFFTENGVKPGIHTTASGLQYEVIVEGTGPKPGASSTVEVHYEGTLIDGTVFDSSYARNEPAQFPLDGVIPGWAEGITLMTQGSTYRLFIPSALAYGERGAGNTIPPNSVLIFKVELLAILN